jgi:hypothetical protein
VRIDAVAEQVIPGWSLPVHAVADGPVDRFTTDADEFKVPDGGLDANPRMGSRVGGP